MIIVKMHLIDALVQLGLLSKLIGNNSRINYSVFQIQKIMYTLHCVSPCLVRKNAVNQIIC